mgnify:CR=1 FL=1
MPKMLLLVRRLIKPDGSVEPYPPKGKTYTLEELQKAVGGYIEILHPPDRALLMVINEEGKLQGLPPNEAATRLMGDRLLPGDYIVGNALVCWNKDID